MSTKEIELEVDFIGGDGYLTSLEEKALSEFFKSRKDSLKQVPQRKKQDIPKRTKSKV